MKLICSIYKSSKKDEMYLYVDKQEDLKRVPDALLEVFGRPVGAMTLLLTPEKKLARVDVQQVMDSIREQGYFLQMPPPREEYLLDLYKAPTEGKY
ncbi:MAG TPA: YcgL domain-containing protein [Motiliproteus sp.]